MNASSCKIVLMRDFFSCLAGFDQVMWMPYETTLCGSQVANSYMYCTFKCIALSDMARQNGRNQYHNFNKDFLNVRVLKMSDFSAMKRVSPLWSKTDFSQERLRSEWINNIFPAMCTLDVKYSVCPWRLGPIVTSIIIQNWRWRPKWSRKPPEVDFD